MFSSTVFAPTEDSSTLANAARSLGPGESTEGTSFVIRAPGIGKADAAIAATAIERDEPVLAGDSHFGTIPGVTLETYR